MKKKKKEEKKIISVSIGEITFETMIDAFNQAEDYDDNSTEDRYFNFRVDIESGEIQEIYLHSTHISHNAEKINL